VWRTAPGPPPGSTVKHHLANARSKVGAETTAQLVWIRAPRLPEPEDRALNTEHLIYVGRAEGWLVVPTLDRPRGQRAIPVGS
jgi:hypothetical protein